MSLALVVLLLIQAGTLVALGLVCMGLGRWATYRLPGAGGALGAAVAVATGLGLCGTAVAVLASVGGLRRPLVLALVAAMTISAVAILRRHRLPLPRGADRWVLLVGAGLLLPVFLWSALPPTAFDATVYHLPFAAAFVEAGGLVETPELLFPVFPQLAEVLFAALLLATGHDTTTHLVQLLASIGTAGLLFAMASATWGRAAGWWAAALWIAHPLVAYQAASAYVDLVLTMFCILALVGWEQWRETAHRGWLALAGAATGWAAATKYLGLVWLGVLLLATLLASGVATRRGRLAAIAILLVGAFAVAGPWYLRIALATGNPIHPLLGAFFGDGSASSLDRSLGLDSLGLDRDPAAAGPSRLAVGARRLAATPIELARFAGDASFRPAAFHRQARLAPWHLLLAPLALVFAARDPHLARWWLFLLIYAVPGTTRDPRFFLPGAALLALLGAGALHHLASLLPIPRRRLTAAAGLAIVLALPGPLYALYKLQRLGPRPPATAAERTAHLARALPAYPCAMALDARASEAVSYSIYAQNLTYYVEGPLRGQGQGPFRLDRVRGLLGDEKALVAELRAMDVEYLLIDRTRVAWTHSSDPHRLLRPILVTPSCALYEVGRPLP